MSTSPLSSLLCNARVRSRRVEVNIETGAPELGAGSGRHGRGENELWMAGCDVAAECPNPQTNGLSSALFARIDSARADGSNIREMRSI